MKLKTKSNLLITILTLAMVLGFFALTIGTTRADDSQIKIVEPSGGDDTDAIQNAFNTVDLGGTVQLIEGDYYIDNIILEGFSGSFKGAGMGLTMIHVYDEITPDPINGITALFKFDGGDVRISDLCFDILPNTPYLDNIMWCTGEINSEITHVKFTGHEGDIIDPYTGFSWNVHAAISITSITEILNGYTTGKHSITKCEFESVETGIETWGLVDSELEVGGGYSAGNTFKGGSFGIYMLNTVNSKLEISHNYIESHVRSCIYVNQLFIPDLWPISWSIMSSQWSISQNSLYTFLIADGIVLYDHYLYETDSWEPSIEAVISRNHITLDNEEWGGMVILGINDAYIMNNVITGVGDYGIDIWDSNNLKIVFNRIQIDTRGTIGNDWGLFYGMSLWFGYNNFVGYNKITHKEADGLYVISSNENLFMGNSIKDNGGYGLYFDDSNDNCIIFNTFYNNVLGNIFDEGVNYYRWNREY